MSPCTCGLEARRREASDRRDWDGVTETENAEHLPSCQRLQVQPPPTRHEDCQSCANLDHQLTKTDEKWHAERAAHADTKVKIEAAEARVAELEEAFSKQCLVPDNPYDSACECCQSRWLRSNKANEPFRPRGLGPAKLAEVREALVAWRNSLAPTREAPHPEHDDEVTREQPGGGPLWRACNAALAIIDAALKPEDK